MNDSLAPRAGRWLRGHVAMALLLVSVVTMGTACSAKITVGEVTGQSTQTATPRQDSPVVAKTDQKDQDGDGIPDATDKCPTQPETKGGWDDDTDGCPDTIADLITLAHDDVNGFWQRTFKAEGKQYRAPDVFEAYSRTIQTPCGASVPMNAFYCPNSNGIYYDTTLFQNALDDQGDFAVVFIVAHEWGHLAQTELGISSDARYSIQLELQADCFAGAYSQDAESRGLLQQGDLDEAAATLFQAGDPKRTPPFAEGAHGTSQQRMDSFTTGYQGGVAACTL